MLDRGRGLKNPRQPVKVGFLINPIAGMGGRVGLKGTDGVLAQAIALGAQPVAEWRATQALIALQSIVNSDARVPIIHWLTYAGEMGELALVEAGFDNVQVLPVESKLSGAELTRVAVAAMVKGGVSLVLFCGGDGTARDICSIAHCRVPILGIPAGVKMFSGVFGTTPQRTAEILARFLKGEIGTAAAEVMDLDEQRYRRGEFVVSLRAIAQVPAEPSYLQSSKSLIETVDDASVKQDIAQYLSERMNQFSQCLYLLGPGSTLQALGKMLGIDKTLLGVDALFNGKLIGRDLNERAMLECLGNYQPGALVLSPIGAQGFVLGRGNQQLSPAVVRKFGMSSIWIAATPAKLAVTTALRFDTGDVGLDHEFAATRYWSVITGYHRHRAVPVKS